MICSFAQTADNHDNFARRNISRKKQKARDFPLLPELTLEYPCSPVLHECVVVEDPLVDLLHSVPPQVHGEVGDAGKQLNETQWEGGQVGVPADWVEKSVIL